MHVPVGSVSLLYFHAVNLKRLKLKRNKLDHKIKLVVSVISLELVFFINVFDKSLGVLSTYEGV